MSCRGIVEHARRIGQNHATLGCGRQVEVVEADRVVGNNLQLRPGRVQQFAVDRVGHQRQQGVAAFGLGLQLRLGQGTILVVHLDIEMLLQLVDVRLRYQSGYKYIRFLHLTVPMLRFRLCGCLALRLPLDFDSGQASRRNARSAPWSQSPMPSTFSACMISMTAAESGSGTPTP